MLLDPTILPRRLREEQREAMTQNQQQEEDEPCTTAQLELDLEEAMDEVMENYFPDDGIHVEESTSTPLGQHRA